jgi:hypothetical protein
MAFETAEPTWQASTWEFLERLAINDGSATHPFVARLAAADAGTRDLSDAVHAICAIHGQPPGLAGDAVATGAQPDAADWLDEIASAFASERAWIAQLAAAAGPLPSTPGQAETEAALIGERHTLDMLARSDRRGCATGAAAALALDWAAIRSVLKRAADRFAVDIPVCRLPAMAETATTVAMLGSTAATERAITFGAQQLLAQHRGLWSLLEARASARDT